MANTARRGKRMEGLSKDEPPSFSGALNKGNPFSFLCWEINCFSSKFVSAKGVIGEY